MTGRRLYDHFTDALVDQTTVWQRDSAKTGSLPNEPLAWPLLDAVEKRIWNDLARRVSPRRSK